MAAPPVRASRPSRRAELRFENLRIDGYSAAGDRTWFRVYPPGLAFDAGRGALQLAGASDLFLSHGHLDHALGLPYVLSRRTRHEDSSTRIFCPAPIREALDGLICAAERLEGVEYRYELVGIEAGDRIEVGNGIAVEAFATHHVVPSLGFHLWRGHRRLGERFRGLEGSRIAELRNAGTTVDEWVERVELTYSGDTGPELFQTEPRLFSSRILMVECTFLGQGLEEKAHRYGHIHLNDLVAQVDQFENEHLVLYHLSRRHRPQELEAAARESLVGLAPALHVIGVPSTADATGAAKPK